MSPRVAPVYKIEVKARIVQAAIECFSEFGFSGTRMEEIAKRVGLGKGTIYLYFESKEDLFGAICEFYLDELKSHFSELLASNLDLVADADKIYDNSKKLGVNQHLMFLEIMLESVHNERLRKALHEHRLKVTQEVKEFLEKQGHLFQRKKDLNPGDLAIGFVALYDGISLNRIQGINDKANRSAWLAMVRAVMSGDD